jgi:DNA-binding transcriptional MerR regulator
MTELWTIEDLCQLAVAALEAVEYEGQPTARVRGAPDKRTIRYYTTLGLLDRPTEMRGRVAYYGRRHVLQLVAIKRLQAKGLSLAQVQESLAGADTSRLARWAAVPESFWEKHQPEPPPPLNPDELLKASPPPAAAAQAETLVQVPERTRSFWREPAVASQPPDSQPPDVANESPSAECPKEAPLLKPQVAALLPLADGVSLLLEHVSADQLDDRRLGELAPALELLVAQLRRLELIP